VAGTLGTAVLELTTDNTKLGSGLKAAEGQAQHTGGILKTAMGTALGFAGAVVGIQAVGAAFNFVKDATIGMNAKLETTTLQFETLMGDADRAKAHVAGLFEFAKKTPFETGPIIDASRMMRTFGGDALDTTKNLTLIGDASAATAAPINELGFWVGRLYSSIQSGRPFGESAMRLSELAVMSPKARAEMEKLQASGASANAVWNVFEKDLGKFSGAMIKQAGTWSGLMSTLKDTVQLGAATAFKPLFERAKEALGGVVSALSDPAIEAGIASFSERLAAGFDTIGTIFGTLVGIVQTVTSNVRLALEGDIGAVVTDVNEIWVNVFGISAPQAVQDFVALAATALLDIRNIVTAVMQGDIPTALNTAFSAWGAFRRGVVDIIMGLIPQVLDGFNRIAKAAVDWITVTALPGLKATLPIFAAELLAWIMATLDKVVHSLLAFGRAFFEWVVPAIPPLLRELLGLLSTMLKWLGDNAPMIGRKLVEWGLLFGEFILTTAIPAIIQHLPGILLTIGAWVLTEGIPGVIRFFFGLGQGIVEGILEGLGGLKTAIWNALVAAFQGIDFWVGPFHVTGHGIYVQMPEFNFPSFQHGGVMPYTGLALVHEGERILTRAQTEREAGGAGGHGHDIYMDGRLVARAVGDRVVRGTALAGGAIG
jgi:hypothetical protein